MPSHPSIDIVLITQNRTDLLLKTLESIHLAVRDFPIRLLLGFNGTSSENQTSILKTLADHKTQYAAREIESLHPGGARNTVLSESRSDWVFFCDDDIVVPESLFSDFYTLANENPTICLIGGPNLTPPGSSPFEIAQGLALGNPLVTGPMADRYRLRHQPFFTTNSRSLTLCNFFLRNAGQIRFPSHYICGEELMLISRVTPPYLISPKLFAYHHRRKTIGAFFKQTVKYGIGRSDFSFSTGVGASITITAAVLSYPKALVLLYATYLLMLLAWLLIQPCPQSLTRADFARKTALSAIIIHSGYIIGLSLGVVHSLVASFARNRI